ncbi:MAG: FecR family protein, partial [Muribaculaceae bacterium]|nr:FecR family protein [Muribaculaceae bacterium]
MKKEHPNYDISYISRLFFLRFKGKLNESDEKTLKDWSSRTKRNRELYQLLTDPDELQREYILQHLIDAGKAEQEMISRLRDIPKATTRRLRHIRAIIAIAILAIPIIWFSIRPAYNNAPLSPDLPQTVSSIEHTEIRPGSTKAIVTTPSGKSITLDGTDASRAALTALLESDTEQAPLPGRMAHDEQLRIDVPRGGEFKIVLEDSTTVWLNSESSLRYPETFSPSNRYVEINGEAYFKVKTDAERPFIVNTG